MLTGCAAVAPSVSGLRFPSFADTKLEFRFDPMVDLYCFMRREIAGYTKLTGRWVEPLESMRKASRMIPARYSFAFLDGFVSDAETLDNLRRLSFSAPEFGPQEIPIREPLGHVYNALRTAMPIYQSDS